MFGNDIIGVRQKALEVRKTIDGGVLRLLSFVSSRLK